MSCSRSFKERLDKAFNGRATVRQRSVLVNGPHGQAALPRTEIWAKDQKSGAPYRVLACVDDKGLPREPGDWVINVLQRRRHEMLYKHLTPSSGAISVDREEAAADAERECRVRNLRADAKAGAIDRFERYTGIKNTIDMSAGSKTSARDTLNSATIRRPRTANGRGQKKA